MDATPRGGLLTNMGVLVAAATLLGVLAQGGATPLAAGPTHWKAYDGAISIDALGNAADRFGKISGLLAHRGHSDARIGELMGG